MHFKTMSSLVEKIEPFITNRNMSIQTHAEFSQILYAIWRKFLSPLSRGRIIESFISSNGMESMISVLEIYREDEVLVELTLNIILDVCKSNKCRIATRHILKHDDRDKIEIISRISKIQPDKEVRRKGALIYKLLNEQKDYFLLGMIEQASLAIDVNLPLNSLNRTALQSLDLKSKENYLATLMISLLNASNECVVRKCLDMISNYISKEEFMVFVEEQKDEFSRNIMKIFEKYWRDDRILYRILYIIKICSQNQHDYRSKFRELGISQYCINVILCKDNSLDVKQLCLFTLANVCEYDEEWTSFSAFGDMKNLGNTMHLQSLYNPLSLRENQYFAKIIGKGLYVENDVQPRIIPSLCDDRRLQVKTKCRFGMTDDHFRSGKRGLV